MLGTCPSITHKDRSEQSRWNTRPEILIVSQKHFWRTTLQPLFKKIQHLLKEEVFKAGRSPILLKQWPERAEVCTVRHREMSGAQV